MVLRTTAKAVTPGGMPLVVRQDVTNLSDGTGGRKDPQRHYGPELITAHLAGWRMERVGRARLDRYTAVYVPAGPPPDPGSHAGPVVDVAHGTWS